MSRAKLYGADYSVYVRIARLALIEKGVDHECIAVDVFSPGGLPAWYLSLHPFGRIPAFEHDGLVLHETTAIVRYVDEAFAGPPLQPADPRSRAVMNQIVGLLDSYAYRAMVWDIYVERVSRPREGTPANEGRIAAALPVAETCLDTLARLKRPGPFLLGGTISLADLHAAPIFAYFLKAPEGRQMLTRFPQLALWWESVAKLPSFAATEPAD
jgi:glutathione S-transferase